MKLVTGLILWAQGAPLDQTIVVPVTFILAINLALGLMIGSVVSVAGGIVGSALVGPTFGIVATLSTGYVGEVIVNTYICCYGAYDDVACDCTGTEPVCPYTVWPIGGRSAKPASR